MLHRASTYVTLCLFLLIACGNNDKLGADDDKKTSSVDTFGDEIPDTPDKPTGNNDPSCDRKGFNVAYQLASGEEGFVDYIAATGTGLPVDQLSIELLHDARPALPYALRLEGENYRTCDTCVTIRSDVGCEGEGCDPKLFLVESAKLIVTTWDIPGDGARFAGTLTDLRAREIHLGDADFDLTSFLVEGGELWCIDTLSFDNPLTPF